MQIILEIPMLGQQRRSVPLLEETGSLTHVTMPSLISNLWEDSSGNMLIYSLMLGQFNAVLQAVFSLAQLILELLPFLVAPLMMQTIHSQLCMLRVVISGEHRMPFALLIRPSMVTG